VARVGIFGAGWVGLVTGACFAELGHHVVIRDVVPEKIGALHRGEVPFHEEDVPALLERNRERLSFTLDVNDVAECEYLFVCVDTPPTYSGDADLSRVWTVVDELPELSGRPVLVMKSTVPVGTGEKVRHGLDARGLEHVGYVSNPEFLAEGGAVRDFMSPDRIVVGAFDPEDGDAVASLYAALDAPIVRCDVNSAEMIKLAANAFLMTRISFINEIANVCEATGADVVKVAEGVGLDRRLGPYFLRAGIGYGGSCLRGQEAVFVREGDQMRMTSLERLFDGLGSGEPAEVEVLAPDALEVLAWHPGARSPSFFRVAAISRRWWEGKLIGVRHGAGRRPRVTPDHPFVVASEPGGVTRVKLAAELTEADWLPLVPLWKTKPDLYPRRVHAWSAFGDSHGATTLEEAERIDVLLDAPLRELSVYWESVKALNRHPYAGYVYSLEVPEAGTFVTTAGLVVHNCFPKDSLALKQLASNSGYHFQLLSAVIEVNELQKRRVIGKLKRHLGSLRGTKVALLGLAFKPETDDMREAPSIVLASRLLAEGAEVRGWDPVADGQALPRGVEVARSVEEAVRGADAAVIVTEWKELRDLAREEIRAAMANPLIIDGRNLLDPATVRAAGFSYEGIGRPGSPTDVLPETAEREPELELD
jgi:UDP-glucose 6-dehydrogenase